jgi:tetratricopeptide (TPR) repeat protein
MRKRGDYAEAEAWLERSSDTYLGLGDGAGVSLVLIDIGEIYRLQGKFLEAKEYYEVSLGFASKIKWPNTRQAARAHILKGAGTVATWRGDLDAARELNRESLAINRELGNVQAVAALLNNLGMIARNQHDLTDARKMYAESLALFRKLGDLWAVGSILNNQAVVASDQGAYAEARASGREFIHLPTTGR